MFANNLSDTQKKVILAAFAGLGSIGLLGVVFFVLPWWDIFKLFLVIVVIPVLTLAALFGVFHSTRTLVMALVLSSRKQAQDLAEQAKDGPKITMPVVTDEAVVPHVAEVTEE